MVGQFSTPIDSPFKTNSRFKHFNIRGNIVSERADAFLPLNREKIHPEGQSLLDNKIMKSLLENKLKVLAAVTNRNFAELYYFLVGSESGSSWQDIELSGHKINTLIAVGSLITVSFDLHGNESVTVPEGTVFVDNRVGSAETLVDVLKQKGLGIVIHNILKEDATNNIGNSVRKVDFYSIEIIADSGASRIESPAIASLSAEKLSKQRTRYWLPCGEQQFPDMTLQNGSPNYPWITELTPFCGLFSHGIILRSTSKTLEDDLPTIVQAIKRERPSAKESTIESSLRSFYSTYQFEGKDEPLNPFWF